MKLIRFGSLIVLVVNVAFTAICVGNQDYGMAFVGFVGSIIAGAVVERYRLELKPKKR